MRHLDFEESKNENQRDLDSPNRHITLVQMIVLQSAVQEEKRQHMTEEIEALRNQLEEAKQSKALKAYKENRISKGIKRAY